MSARRTLIYLAVIHNGDWEAIMKDIEEKISVPKEEVDKVLSKIRSQTVTLLDDDYPIALKQMIRPPFVLFYRGNLSLIKDYKKCISYIGSREASPYGMNTCEDICRQLASEGYSVVSGLAMGIDTQSAIASLPYGKAVAVIGCGLDRYYPAENSSLQREIAKEGLLLSEYPDDCRPTKTAFPERNRIIAGISKLVVVGEAKTNSGTLITVAYALGAGRDVACIPFPAGIGSSNNKLIKQGSYLVEDADDIKFLLE